MRFNPKIEYRYNTYIDPLSRWWVVVGLLLLMGFVVEVTVHALR